MADASMLFLVRNMGRLPARARLAEVDFLRPL